MLTVIILSGGKSSRMGTEKGLVKLNGKCLIEHVIDEAKKISGEIIIVANSTEYYRFRYKVFSDIIKNCGPMGGIYTGLVNSETEKNLVLSCDIPCLNVKLLKYLIENSSGYEITVPVHNGKIEPLCAVYEKKCTGKFKKLLLKKELKVMDALKKFSINELDVSKKTFYSEILFRNINTKAELSNQALFL